MESKALGRLVDQHAAALVLYARQWSEAPEDIVQEAFLKLAGQGVVPANPAAWLFRVVRNAAINAAKAEHRRRRREADAASRSAGWFLGDPLATTSAQALDSETAEAELRLLPLEQREVIVAHLWGGLTFEQIAEAIGCSSSTAHRLYGAGLSTIRERLGVLCRESRRIPS